MGLLLVQMAKRRGARVIGTVGTEAKAALAREAGADEVILYTQEDFLEAVKRLTGGRGVDVVYDSVGKTTAEKSLDCLVPRGMMVFFGNASGPVPPIDPLVLSRKGSLFLTRPSLVHYIADRASLEARAADVLGDAAAGRLKVRIDRTYPLAEAAEAHRALEGRQTTGKVLLDPVDGTSAAEEQHESGRHRGVRRHRPHRRPRPAEARPGAGRGPRPREGRGDEPPRLQAARGDSSGSSSA